MTRKRAALGGRDRAKIPTGDPQGESAGAYAENDAATTCGDGRPDSRVTIVRAGALGAPGWRAAVTQIAERGRAVRSSGDTLAAAVRNA